MKSNIFSGIETKGLCKSILLAAEALFRPNTILLVKTIFTDKVWKDLKLQNSYGFFYFLIFDFPKYKCRKVLKCYKIWYFPNRLSSTIGGNNEINQLYTTSQVSNITRKTKLSHISWHIFQDWIKKCQNRN